MKGARKEGTDKAIDLLEKGKGLSYYDKPLRRGNRG